MPIDYYWPDAGEKYLYVRLSGWDDEIDITSPELFLALPIRAGHTNHIREIETSRFDNDRSRSYNGATNVRHMAVDGQLLLEFNPEQAARYREHRARYRGRGLSDPNVGYKPANGFFIPGPCALDQQFHTIEGFSLTPSLRRVSVNKWDDDEHNLDHFTSDHEVDALVIGFSDKGTFSYEWQRAWVHDTYRVTIRWNVNRVTGNVGVGFEFDIHVPEGGLPAVSLPNLPVDSSTYGEGIYHCKRSIQHLNISSHLRESFKSCNQDKEANYAASDFGVINLVAENTEMRSFRKDWHDWDDHPWSGWHNMKCQTFVGYAPWWGSYHMVLPENRLDDLYNEFQQLEDWIVGQQTFLWSFSEVEAYNLGYKPKGKNRGPYTIWTTLEKKAIENNRAIDSSLWMFFQDLKNAREDWGNLAKQFETDAKFFLNHKRSPLMKIHWVEVGKHGSNTYLPILYGWRLTQAEAENLGEALQKLLFEQTPWRKSIRYLGPERETESFREDKFVEGFSGKVLFCWQADVNPDWNAFSKWYARLDELKLWLSLKDAWDWVKYSFVLNWLTKVPLQLLEWYDFQAWKQNYALLQVQRSVKFEGKITAFSAIGNYALAYPDQLLDCKYYRRYWNNLFDPMPSFQTHIGGNTIFDHLIETSALVIQRL